jgi:hypothetical protein
MHDESKLTRRVFFRGAATLAGAALVGAVIPVRDARAQQKLAKSVMQYQDTPKNGQRCDECVYFKPPSACGLIEGTISPQGWCTAFNKKS